MAQRRPLYRNRYRRYHRTGRNDFKRAFLNRAEISPVFSCLVTLFAAGAVFLAVLLLFEAKIQPVLITVATANTRNKITAVLEQSMGRSLDSSSICYNDLVIMQRDEEGKIASLTSDMAAMNRLRSAMISAAMDSLGKISITDLSIPVGSLIHSGLLWGCGPHIQARAMSIGTISAEFNSQFTSAGVNQTLHRISLDLSVPVTILLPGKSISVPIQYKICVAETVIVGGVPGTFLYH